VSHTTLNLGILAHVDAGKTTLTERLLYAAGAIEELGSVDDGTTRTDSLALERQRGITIKSAVASFAIGDVTVNLIDTPGHPDFIAEVERVLSVLDGAVLVVSAVEGVQPQTRILMRALRRIGVPTLIFVNKVDRPGASEDRVVQAVSGRLTPAIVPMGSVRQIGTRDADVTPWDPDDEAFRARLAEVLAEHDAGLFAAYVDDERGVSDDALRQALAAQTKSALVYPVFFGSALTGAGVVSLTAGIAELLPAAEGDIDGPVSGAVFKIERGAGGEKIAYVRMFSGTVRTRDRLRFGQGHEEKVTAISVFDDGVADPRGAPRRRADRKALGARRGPDRRHDRPSRGLHDKASLRCADTRVRGRSGQSRRQGALRVALAQLAEQDPLINVRQDDTLQEFSVSLYGEVQKEVIQATLAEDFGLDVSFRPTTVICIERPSGTGEAVEVLHAESNPFLATIGLRVEPAAIGSGIEFRLRVDPRSVPQYLYKTVDRFTDSMDHYVRRTLQEGIFGWQVTDCTVTMTRCTYSVPDGPPSRRGPLSTAADFRKLTPLVVMQALERAGTVVCEPMLRVSLEIPAPTIGPVLALLARLGAVAPPPSLHGGLATIETALPAARARDLQRQLPALTSGDGVLESDFGGYRPASGQAPARRRVMANPLNREEYLMHVARRVS
jgi:ribosomal protection tetracycline resistance protein